MREAAKWPAPSARRWVERSLGADIEVVDSASLIGGLTAEMFALTLSRPVGEASTVVLRCWPPEATWGPDHVVREATGLATIASSGLPVPRMLADDPTGEQAGTPATLTTIVGGEVDLAPADLDDWLRRLAEMAARIHDLPAETLPACEEFFDPAKVDLQWLGDPGLATEAIGAATMPQVHQTCLCHGDYQHFNVLWTRGRISGVVDWPSMGRGARGLDVGHCRLNLALLYSVDAAERFRQCYEAAAGCVVDRAADLQSLLGFDSGWPHFIPKQVAGRAPVDGPGMALRVRDVIALALNR